MSQIKDSLRIKLDPVTAKDLNALMKAEPWRDRGDLIRELLREALTVRQIATDKARKKLSPKPG